MLSSFLVSLLSRIIPRCLTWSILVSSKEEYWFHSCQDSFVCTEDHLCFIWINREATHHFSILFRATCITSNTVLRFLPATRAEKSSANPCAKYPTEFNACNRPSAISIHISADRTPPKPVLDMTYNVFGGTLNLAQLQLLPLPLGRVIL